jgi:hypothetical protein
MLEQSLLAPPLSDTLTMLEALAMALPEPCDDPVFEHLYFPALLAALEQEAKPLSALLAALEQAIKPIPDEPV